MRNLPENVPQIVAIVAVSREGKFNLVKAARQYLGLKQGQPLFLDVGDEVLLSSGSGDEVPTKGHGRVTLPPEALDRLGVSGAAHIALVQRPGALAVKRVKTAEVPGTHARLTDIETPFAIVRQVETTPLPDQLLPELRSRYADLKLQHDVSAYLSGRETLSAWRARQVIGRPDPGDDALRQSLIDGMLGEQAEDGSWEGQVALTARRLRELAGLGLAADREAVGRGAGWLLARPRSEANPGMFFGSDALVAAQAKVLDERARGIRSRFRKIARPEQKRVMASDDLIRTPCGPRIMWPNALAIEALLLLGYESHERVQAALWTMSTHDWCECGYQHGTSSWRRTEPMTDAQVDEFEARCIRQYRYGGLRELELLLKEADLASRSHLLRVVEQHRNGRREYPLHMPDHIQGCEFITTRALAAVQDPQLRRFAEAHLWRFAGIQRPDGLFPKESHGTGFGAYGILGAFARYDHPASSVVIARALPWIVEAQNADGSWGDTAPDAATLAVVCALDRVLILDL